MPSDDPVMLRLPVHWESWVTFALGLGVFPTGGYLLLRGLDEPSILLGVIGVVLALLGFPLLAFSGREVFRRPRLHARTLVLPRTFHRSRHVPLEQISGVGLLYEIGGPRAGWSMRIWLADGNTYGIDSVRSYARGKRPAQQPPPPEGTPRWHRPRLDWGAQARTPAGRAALAVTRQVLAVQGTAGVLATSMDQCFAPSFETYLAYWSPDGQIGWLGGDDLPTDGELPIAVD
jgi:hypothetical protein